MGLANYVLENQELTEMRLRDLSDDEFFLDSSPAQSIKRKKKSQTTKKKHQKRYSCPFCNRIFADKNEARIHFNIEHNLKYYSFFSVNNKILSQDSFYNRLDTLIAHNLDGEETMFSISSVHGESFSFSLSEENSYKDISYLLKKQKYEIYSLRVERNEIKEEYTLSPFIDVSNVLFEDIINHNIESNYLYPHIDTFKSAKEFLNLINIIICEEKLCEDKASLIEEVSSEVRSRINNGSINTDEKELLDLLVICSLFISFEIPINYDEKTMKCLEIIRAIMNVEQIDYTRFIDEIKKPDSLLIVQTLLLISYLRKDKGLIDYYDRQVSYEGLLGKLCRLLKVISTDCNFKKEDVIDYNYLTYFRKYPLINCVCNAKEATVDGVELERATYEFFNKISSPICQLRIDQENDPSVKKKLVRSINKRLKNPEQENKSIWERIEYRNGLIKHPINNDLLNSFKNNKQIYITQLGMSDAGRGNCIIVSYQGFNYMFDCGLNVQAKNNQLPDFSCFEKQVDAIFISHAHLDHCGAVAIAHSYWPDAPIFTTHATKSFIESFLYDISSSEDIEDFEFGRRINRSMAADTYDSIIGIEYGDSISISGQENIRVRFHHAGHMLGAAMIELFIKDKTILYTGDFSPYDQILSSRIKYEYLPQNPDLLICEATMLLKTGSVPNWITQRDDLKYKIEKNISDNVILLPSNAIGKCQELLCVVFELMRESRIPEDTRVFVGGFAAKTTVAASKHIHDSLLNEFYQKIELLDETVTFDSPSIIIGSSASLSRNSFSYNALKLLSERRPPKYMLIASGHISEDAHRLLNRNKILNYSLCSHVARDMLLEFISNLTPKMVLLNHWGSACRKEKENEIDEIYKKHNGRMLIFDFDEHGTISMQKIIKDFVERMPLWID